VKKFIIENSKTSAFVNTFINSLIPYFVLYDKSFVNLKGNTPNFLSTFLPAVIGSVFITTIVTFGILTNKRKNGAVELPINPNATWFYKSIISGLVIAFYFGNIALIVIVLLQYFSVNFQINKITAIILSSFMGAFSAYYASFIAVKYASKIQ
jgi:hypothetical protein